MEFVLALILGIPWFREGWSAWQNRRIVRRECAMIDFEHELLS